MQGLLINKFSILYFTLKFFNFQVFIRFFFLLFNLLLSRWNIFNLFCLWLRREWTFLFLQGCWLNFGMHVWNWGFRVLRRQFPLWRFFSQQCFRLLLQLFSCPSFFFDANTAMSTTQSSWSKTTFVKVSMRGVGILTLTPFRLFRLLNAKRVFVLFVCRKLHRFFFEFFKTLSLKTLAQRWINLFNNFSFIRNYLLFLQFMRFSFIPILLPLYFLKRLLWLFDNFLLGHLKIRCLQVVRWRYRRGRSVV